VNYDFKCPVCAKKASLSVPIADYSYGLHAPLCHGRMKQVFNNLGLSDAHDNRGFPYIDENLGDKPVRVESQTHRRQLLKERGLHDREASQGAKDRARTAKRKSFYMGR
jgi:predicted nucleic acid-binding Zn ribbon protein